jgi:uncharacterized membrane protein YhaH (DUF805 family)
MKESINWFMTALKKYSVFDGRAQRKEYWFFILIYLLTIIPLGIVDFFTGTMNEMTGLGFLSGIYMLLMLCPTLAVTARRLHDTNKSGWLQLLNLLPLVGFFVIIYFTVQDSQPETNQYGSNPKTEKTQISI